jgi:hypothetical protein
VYYVYSAIILTVELPSNAKKKGFVWKFLYPISPKQMSSAIYPNVYLAPHIWDGLHKNPPDHLSVAVLLHEQEHIKRQKKMGWIKWGLRYTFDEKFRLEEELAAVVPMMKYMKENNQTMDLPKMARNLSGYIYLWCVSYDEALRRLREMWDGA